MCWPSGAAAEGPSHPLWGSWWEARCICASWPLGEFGGTMADRARKPRKRLVAEPKANGQATIERVTKVVWALAHGEALNVRAVTAMTGLSRQDAYRLLCKISRVAPIYDDPITHIWQALAMREAEIE